MPRPLGRHVPSGHHLDSGQSSAVQQQVETQGRHGQTHGYTADAPGGMDQAVKCQELRRNHQRSPLVMGRTWCAGTPVALGLAL